MDRKWLLNFALCLLISCFLLNFFTRSIAANPISSTDVLDEVQSFNGVVGIYAKNLKTGKTIGFQEDRAFPTASTSKLVVAMAVYKYIYPFASEEQKKLYNDYINLMIEVSDNEAFYTLLNVIAETNPDVLNDVVRDLGLQQTRVHNAEAFQVYQYHSVTTPREMAIVMECIFNDKYIEHEKSEQLKNELANTIFKDEIPRYIPARVMDNSQLVTDNLPVQTHNIVKRHAYLGRQMLMSCTLIQKHL